MLKLNFKPFPDLTGERLLLRRMTIADGPEIFIQRSDPRILKYIKREPVADLNEAVDWIKKINEREENNESIMWAIVPKGESKLVGTVCYWNVEPENHKAEIGYGLHPDYFGKGFMHETLSLVIPYGFETMNLEVIDAYTNKDNLPSHKLLMRNGFERNVNFENQYVSKEELEYNVVYTLNRR
jgi:ribosomal-protein-alanine N-acetyltransferase